MTAVVVELERHEHMRFIGKFQQVPSPVTAKGIEDTALYIYNRLASLNEVGGEPDRFGIAPHTLHAWLAARAAQWPHALSATSTHDTKRSEDVRAPLNVLSELPGAWKEAIARWARANRRGRSVIDGQSYPSRNVEYLLYQTLIGTWPAAPMTADEERDYWNRIGAYMYKAMREAQVFTSWLNPSEPHEQAMARFVESTLAPDNTAFRDDFVDFQRRRSLLSEISDADAEQDRLLLATRLMAAPHDDRLKLVATATLLRFRRDRPQLFQFGSYEALAMEGSRREHLFAFARTQEGRQVLVVVPRLLAALLPDADVPPLGERVWADTRVVLPPGAAGGYRHVFTNRCVAARQDGDRAALSAAEMFEHFPIAFLERH